MPSYSTAQKPLTTDTARISVSRTDYVELARNAETGLFCCSRVATLTTLHSQQRDTLAIRAVEMARLRDNLTDTRAKYRKLRQRTVISTLLFSAATGMLLIR